MVTWYLIVRDHVRRFVPLPAILPYFHPRHSVLQNPLTEVCPSNLSPFIQFRTLCTQRSTHNLFGINDFRTLSHATDGVSPALPTIRINTYEKTRGGVPRVSQAKAAQTVSLSRGIPSVRGLCLCESLRTAFTPTWSGRLCIIFFRSLPRVTKHGSRQGLSWVDCAYGNGGVQ